MKSSAVFTLNLFVLRRIRARVRDTAAEDDHATAEGFLVQCLRTRKPMARTLSR